MQKLKNSEFWGDVHLDTKNMLWWKILGLRAKIARKFLALQYDETPEYSYSWRISSTHLPIGKLYL